MRLVTFETEAADLVVEVFGLLDSFLFLSHVKDDNEDHEKKKDNNNNPNDVCWSSLVNS